MKEEDWMEETAAQLLAVVQRWAPYDDEPQPERMMRAMLCLAAYEEDLKRVCAGARPIRSSYPIPLPTPSRPQFSIRAGDTVWVPAPDEETFGDNWTYAFAGTVLPTVRMSDNGMDLMVDVRDQDDDVWTVEIFRLTRLDAEVGVSDRGSDTEATDWMARIREYATQMLDPHVTSDPVMARHYHDQIGECLDAQEGIRHRDLLSAALRCLQRENLATALAFDPLIPLPGSQSVRGSEVKTIRVHYGTKSDEVRPYVSLGLSKGALMTCWCDTDEEATTLAEDLRAQINKSTLIPTTP